MSASVSVVKCMKKSLQKLEMVKQDVLLGEFVAVKEKV